MNEPILGKIQELGLGFGRNSEREGGRKRNGLKNERNRVASLLYKRLNRVDPNPVHSLSLPAV